MADENYLGEPKADVPEGLEPERDLHFMFEAAGYDGPIIETITLDPLQDLVRVAYVEQRDMTRDVQTSREIIVRAEPVKNEIGRIITAARDLIDAALEHAREFPDPA